ncbi:tripartite tricarboxylate transporter permease [Alkalihalobacillus oceani]|uniref:tripartite tricarboxylate transporter permease n=1 Tax=Halalkalibacter oceani TaxID=1653776 RepID=UPI00203AB8DD|nr:tripartite tricarboxylate transporter permease [Halalkalibacter oceani]MCM3762295.1 tripartite tricarboxylate transporter permease [Halalkalibacter oceani]
MSAEILIEVLGNMFLWETVVAIIIGVIGGMLVGSLPGLSATMAIALLIPLTFGMAPITGLVLLVSVYTAGVYGGSIAAILLQTPGTPSSAATAIDGYQLTLQGKGAKAIGIATISSVTGGVVGGIALLFLAPPLASFSLRFSAPEYFLIAIFGLTIVGGLAGKSMGKGIAAAGFGLVIGCIGVDMLTGYPRFTFGQASLEAGISLIPAMIGLFSISQVMMLAEERRKKKVKTTVAKISGEVLPTRKEFKSILKTLMRSSGIGVLVGILPGAGGDIGSWIGYNDAKRSSKNKEKFGKGALEGVAGPESANNAVVGGALIPTLTLGIPGSAATAILLGGLYMQGFIPGHELFTVHAVTTYSMIFGFIIATITVGIIGLLAAKYFAKVAKVSNGILAPIIVALSVIGSYAINNNIFDIWVMLAFGIIGYLMRKTGFHPAPVVLGMILGPIAEQGLRQSFMMTSESILTYYLSRPISVALIILTIATLFGPTVVKWVKIKRNKKVKAA